MEHYEALRPAMARPEVEASLLGILMVYPETISGVAGQLSPEHFATDLYAEAYATIVSMVQDGKRVSPLAVSAYLASHPDIDGDPHHIAELAGAVLGVSALDGYVSIIIDLWKRRTMAMHIAEMSERLQMMSIDDDASRIAADFQVAIDDVSMAHSSETPLTPSVLAKQIAEDLDRPIDCDRTGLERLDKVMGGGLYPGRVYGIVARKKAGKTTLAGQISANLNKSGVLHDYFALEMGAKEIFQRIMSSDIGYNPLCFVGQMRNNVAFRESVQRYQPANDLIRFHDVPGCQFEALKRRVYQAAAGSKKARGIILDYLQLVGGQPRGKSRAEHLDEISQWLADVAKRFNVWVLVLAQLNQAKDGDANIRGGEGLALACDMLFHMKLCVDEDGVDRPGSVWLDMKDSRYTTIDSVGDEHNPGLILMDRNGLYFEGM